MAARNGDTLISTNVLATVVCVSDAMKKKNVPDRNSPDSRPGLPTASTARGMPRPCIASSTPATNSDMNSDRQNTISHAFVIDSCRTRMPPDDQQIAATIMNDDRAAMARVSGWSLRGCGERWGGATKGSAPVSLAPADPGPWRQGIKANAARCRGLA